MKKIYEYFRNLRRRCNFKPGPSYSFCVLPEEPDKISPRVIYIVGSWALAFKCPCNCGDDIWLNLLEGHSQQWEIKFDSPTEISIAPSVNRIVGCRSHFFIWRNRVSWVLNKD